MNRHNAPSDQPRRLLRKPQAWASIRGSAEHPQIRGSVRFYQREYGVFVLAELSSLPSPKGDCAHPIFGFHIHEGTSCKGNGTDPFADTMGHYDKSSCPHPYHSGDMPPLFGVNGKAFSAFLTDRFTVREIVGRTVVVHAMPDDFITQPSGNAGMKIACGVIVGYGNG